MIKNKVHFKINSNSQEHGISTQAKITGSMSKKFQFEWIRNIYCAITSVQEI